MALLEEMLKIHAPHLQIDNQNDGNHLQAGNDNEVARVASPKDPSQHQAALTSPLEANAQVGQRQHEQQTTPASQRQSTTGAVGRVESGQAADTPQTSISESRIGPEQPIAHDVGLLSLGNASSDPKYLGPSSGVSFARLLYAAAPQSQGLPASTSDASLYDQRALNEPVPCASLPTVSQMHRFVGQYPRSPLYGFHPDQR